jgi:hypothetical protein
MGLTTQRVLLQSLRRLDALVFLSLALTVFNVYITIRYGKSFIAEKIPRVYSEPNHVFSRRSLLADDPFD